MQPVMAATYGPAGARPQPGTAADTQEFPPLQPGASREVKLDGKTSGGFKYLVLIVDPTNVIPAGQKQDNPQFEVIP